MKQRKIKKRKFTKNEAMLGLFLKALASLYPQDTLAPGLVLAYLPSKQVFYGSVCRYTPEKKIMTKVTGDSIVEVLRQLAEQWIQNAQPALDFAKAMPKGGAQ